MANLFIKILMAISFLCCLTTHSFADNKIYKGIWPGGNSASLQIVDENKKSARYCFKRQCATLKYTGSTEKLRLISPDKVHFTFKKNGNTYSGRWRRGNSTSKVVLK